ncbi:MAG: hypothetical protein ACJAZ3_001527 [Sphingobacteriales bacterium]|jgi:hypothetical protein
MFIVNLMKTIPWMGVVLDRKSGKLFTTCFGGCLSSVFDYYDWRQKNKDDPYYKFYVTQLKD